MQPNFSLVVCTVLTCLCCVCGSSTCSITSAQDQPPDPIHEKLDLLIASRKKIETYQVKMIGVLATREMATTVGNLRINSIVDVHIEIVANRTNNQYLLIAQREPAFPNFTYLGDRPLGELSDVFLIDQKKVRRLGNGKFQPSDLDRIPYPEPLALGCGFCLEASRFTPFMDSIANLKSWSSSRMVYDQQGPLQRFGNPLHSRPGLFTTHITFDASRDYILRSIGHRNTDTIHALADVEPIRVDGHWLPSRATYQCGSQFKTWELDWVSVNQALPADVFDEDSVLAMLDGAP